MPGSAMIARLTAETRAHFAEVDGELDGLFEACTTRGDYIVFLERVLGFEAALEVALALTPGLAGLVELSARQKAHRVALDLVALGVAAPEIATLRHCEIAPFPGIAEALGWLFVAERQTLAHPLVARHLAKALPEEAARASRYLSSYDGIVGARWRELGEALDAHAIHPGLATRTIAAAHEAFRCQRRWLDGDSLRLAV